MKGLVPGPARGRAILVRGEDDQPRIRGESEEQVVDRAHRRPLDRATILRQLRDSLPGLRTSHGVRSLALFGSYARGTAGRHSDSEILVEFDQTPSLLQVIDVEQLLSNLLGSNGYLVMRRALKPEISRTIIADLIPV